MYLLTKEKVSKYGREMPFTVTILMTVKFLPINHFNDFSFIIFSFFLFSVFF